MLRLTVFIGILGSPEVFRGRGGWALSGIYWSAVPHWTVRLSYYFGEYSVIATVFWGYFGHAKVSQAARIGGVSEGEEKDRELKRIWTIPELIRNCVSKPSTAIQPQNLIYLESALKFECKASLLDLKCVLIRMLLDVELETVDCAACLQLGRTWCWRLVWEQGIESIS